MTRDNHSRTKANHLQTNGICERFHKTLQDECYSLLFRKKLYRVPGQLELLRQDSQTPPILLGIAREEWSISRSAGRRPQLMGSGRGANGPCR